MKYSVSFFYALIAAFLLSTAVQAQNIPTHQVGIEGYIENNTAYLSVRVVGSNLNMSEIYVYVSGAIVQGGSYTFVASPMESPQPGGGHTYAMELSFPTTNVEDTEVMVDVVVPSAGPTPRVGRKHFYRLRWDTVMN